jgi:hypothetical protein
MNILANNDDCHLLHKHPDTIRVQLAIGIKKSCTISTSSLLSQRAPNQISEALLPMSNRSLHMPGLSPGTLWSLAKINQILIQPFLRTIALQPSLGPEHLRLRIDGRIIVHKDQCHAYGRPSRDHPLMKGERHIRDTRCRRWDTPYDTRHPSINNSRKVGHLL